MKFVANRDWPRVYVPQFSPLWILKGEVRGTERYSISLSGLGSCGSTALVSNRNDLVIFLAFFEISSLQRSPLRRSSNQAFILAASETNQAQIATKAIDNTPREKEASILVFNIGFFLNASSMKSSAIISTSAV